MARGEDIRGKESGKKGADHFDVRWLVFLILNSGESGGGVLRVDERKRRSLSRRSKSRKKKAKQREPSREGKKRGKERTQ